MPPHVASAGMAALTVVIVLFAFVAILAANASGGHWLIAIAATTEHVGSAARTNTSTQRRLLRLLAGGRAVFSRVAEQRVQRFEQHAQQSFVHHRLH